VKPDPEALIRKAISLIWETYEAHVDNSRIRSMEVKIDLKTGWATVTPTLAVGKVSRETGTA